ncbi:histidine kinase [Halomicroarcula sp. F13]|uniref:histidine kinase n=1 Tax=Haloarcula rubra TaxID=2487747 RepID=A0AAW4PSX7_9EURY|nr:histidine kinase N-terminal 7TM domain-containing protein [Halomicroarcula rubra]MBX0323791.1 histidine kinase [Halomicroarcula rubra]
MQLADVSPAFLAYVAAYGLATLACVVALSRARAVADPDTRRGLVALVVASGGWAALELAFLVLPSTELKYGAYVLSLVVGLATVGAWLYFCSAYTGRSFHRNGTYRRLAVAVYLAIVTVKLTNPIHGWYFETAFVATPFPHLTIVHETLHWVVSGLSYALVAVGFFMLYELFLEADYDTRPLAALVGVTGLPVLFDVVGFASDRLLDINYEPLGVAVFAVGVLYVFETEFLAVQLTDGVDDPVVYLDDSDRIREFNGRARRLFPALSTAVGDPLDATLPDVAAALDSADGILELTDDGETAYFLVSDTSFTLGQVDIGRVVVFTDVTRVERQRRELERQNEQLEGFAAAIRHELLNTLQIVSARVDIAGDALEDGEVSTARNSLSTASETAERMSDIVDDLATLARYGQTVDDRTTFDLGGVVRAAWDRTDTDGMTLTMDGGAEVTADPERVQDVFANGFSFAAHNGASTVTVRVTDDGFTITDDGDPVGEQDPDSFFAYGTAVPDAEAGMTLPNLRMLAETHGWTVTLETDYDDGVRIVVSNVGTLDGRAESEGRVGDPSG